MCLLVQARLCPHSHISVVVGTASGREVAFWFSSNGAESVGRTGAFRQKQHLGWECGRPLTVAPLWAPSVQMGSPPQPPARSGSSPLGPGEWDMGLPTDHLWGSWVEDGCTGNFSLWDPAGAQGQCLDGSWFSDAA